jgi:hypothetical protein
MLGSAGIVIPLMPRKKPQGEPRAWDGDLSALAAEIGVNDLAMLERVLSGEEEAPADLARKILKAAGVQVRRRRVGRPRKFDTPRHPLEGWIERECGGDRELAAEKIGLSVDQLNHILVWASFPKREKAIEIKHLTGISLDELLEPPKYST